MKERTHASKDLRADLVRMAQKAKAAAVRLATLDTQAKNEVLRDMAAALEAGAAAILAANAKDLAAARQKRLSDAFRERLTLTPQRVSEMATSLSAIADLDDPVGQIVKSWSRPNGLKIAKVRVPIGVILIIYESRPNVTSDCVGLCFKSGNVVMLRGGSDALHSNTAIFGLLAAAVWRRGLPAGTVNLVTTTDRKAVDVLLSLDDAIDLVMPRGGESLIREVRDKSKIPVIKHYKGICHIFVDDAADRPMAEHIVLNAKEIGRAACRERV